MLTGARCSVFESFYLKRHQLESQKGKNLSKFIECIIQDVTIWYKFDSMIRSSHNLFW